MKKRNIGHKIILIIAGIYLILPLIATFLFAFATKWQTTILPEGYTTAWFKELWKDPQFIQSMLRSITVSTISVLIILILIVPSVYFVLIYIPRFDKILQVLAILPFALPAVIMAVGLIQIYSKGPIIITGTVWILLGAYFVLCLPFMYQTTKNSLRTINAVELLEAAESLGAARWESFLKVILPNILPGVIVAGLLTFSILFGEFVYVNLLVGSRYATIQFYLYKMMYKNGHLASAVVCTYFIVILLLSFLAVYIAQGSSKSRKKKHNKKVDMKGGRINEPYFN